MYNKKNVIIIVMCVCIMLFAVGYATFQTVLNINGTANIASNWDVRFTSIVQSEKIGNASEKTAASYSERTATIDVNLDVPGDSISYILTLTNTGNLDAIIENVDAKASGSSAIVYTLSGLKNGQKIKAGENIPITITIEYDKTVTSQPVNTTKKLVIDISVVQDLKQSVTETTPSIVESTLLSTAILGKNNSNVVNSGDGLYVSNATNDGRPTYYYKGNVTNNYVDFAGQTWRVVRINEDGTIKLILDDRINNTTYQFNPNYNNYKYMYYSESDVTNGIKNTVDTWYTNTLKTNYDSYIATTNFCEAAKVKLSDAYTSGNATMESSSSSYTPNFKCELDGNGKQYVNAKVGLITADEVAMAGIPLYTGSQTNNTNTYLQKSYYWWTMSPAGFNNDSDYARAWRVNNDGSVGSNYVDNYVGVRPVISLDANIKINDSNGNGVHGSSTNPFVIKTN